MNNCSDCINGKMIRSKSGGFKYICKLQTEKEVRWCLANNKRSFVPAQKEEEKMAEFEKSPIEIVSADEPIKVKWPIEIEGYCLLFDADRIDHMINRQCALDIPDRIPIIWENYMGSPENVIGTCWVSRIDDTGVFVKGILRNLSTDRRDKLIDCSENFCISAGGNKMKLDDKNHVSELSIKYCGIISKNNAMYLQKDVNDSIKILRY